MEDTFPDLGSLSDEELKDLIDKLTEEENEISYKRRVLHGKIDILRAELVNRLRQKREQGDSLISGDDVAQLTEILAGKAQAPPEDEPGRLSGEQADGRPLSRVRVRQPRGRQLLPEVRRLPGRPATAEGGEDPTTMTYKVDDTGDMQPIDIDEAVERSGAALVIRAGGGRAGESFTVDRGPDQHRPQPRRRRLPRRRHRLPQPRAAGAPPRRPLHRRPRLAQRHLRQPAPDRVPPARRRRRDPGRQVQAQLPGEVRRWPSPRQQARRARLAPAQGADDRRRLQDPAERVRRHLDLEDPLPRGPEAADAAPHARAATASTASPTSNGCARSCACSATSSCRCG